MHVSEKFVGKVVAIQLGRPLYIVDYAAHLKIAGQTSLMGEPVVRAEQPLVMDMLLGARVTEVLPDNITVEMMTPGGHYVHKTVPSALILGIDEIVEFEPTDLPEVTKRVRQGAASSKIIL